MYMLLFNPKQHTIILKIQNHKLRKTSIKEAEKHKHKKTQPLERRHVIQINSGRNILNMFIATYIEGPFLTFRRLNDRRLDMIVKG